VEEGQDVRGIASMRRVESWGENGGYYEAVDCLRFVGEQGTIE